MHAGPEPCNIKQVQTLQTDMQAPTNDQMGSPTADRLVGSLTNDRAGDVATEEGACPENCTDGRCQRRPRRGLCFRTPLCMRTALCPDGGLRSGMRVQRLTTASDLRSGTQMAQAQKHTKRWAECVHRTLRTVVQRRVLTLSMPPMICAQRGRRSDRQARDGRPYRYRQPCHQLCTTPAVTCLLQKLKGIIRHTHEADGGCLHPGAVLHSWAQPAARHCPGLEEVRAGANPTERGPNDMCTPPRPRMWNWESDMCMNQCMA